MSRAFYESYWSRRDAPPDHDPTTPARKRGLLESLHRFGVPQSGRILDLGCGAGEFSQFIANAGYRPVGIDIAEAAIDRARREHPQLEFRVMNADLTIPANPAEFDAVWSTEVIEHVFDVHLHFCEINRVLRDGGVCILTTPFHGRLKNILISLLKFDRHFDPDGGHIRFFDRRGLDRCLTRAGLQPVLWGGIGRIWPLYRTWFVVARKSGDAVSRR
jgi:2-polyprenyl-6-hydroxyphenyl methylase/3-demethylubiquinone-9 3-methyltransferase